MIQWPLSPHPTVVTHMHDAILDRLIPNLPADCYGGVSSAEARKTTPADPQKNFKIHLETFMHLP